MSNNYCVLSGYFQYPLKSLTEQQKINFINQFTYESPFIDDDGTRKRIEMYKLDEDYIHLPLAWVKANYPKLYSMAVDERVTPGELTYTKLPDPNHPAVKDPAGQMKFMDDLLNAVKTKEQVFAVAKTGSGKTVCALKTAALLGHRTLVLVDKNNLKDQWIREIQDKLGVPKDKIGVIQQDKCEYEDKDIVVGLLQTNARRDYPEEVYKAFGTIIVDEVDVIATEFFNDVLPKFKAKYRIGLTATPNRKDGSDIVMRYHLGDIAVTSEAEVLPVKVHVFKYFSEKKVWGKDDKQHALSISKDKDFAALVNKYVLDCYKNDRNILVVAEKIDNLEYLIKLAIESGIPEKDIGQFTSDRSKYDNVYTWKVIGRRKSSNQELENAKTKRVVYATIGMVKRAVDVPRWDTLIEAAPLWQGAQLLGRIRRKHKDKKYPIAITFRHMKSAFAETRYYSRYKEYVECQAKIIHH